MYRKEQGKQLDRLEVARQELELYEQSVREKLALREHSLNCIENHIVHMNEELHNKYFGGYKRSRFDLVYLNPGRVPTISIGTQTDTPAEEDNPDTTIYPRK